MNKLPPAEQEPQIPGPETQLHYDDQRLTETLLTPDAAQEPQTRAAGVTPTGTEQLDTALGEGAPDQDPKDGFIKILPSPYHSKTSGRSDLPAAPRDPRLPLQ